ncbi:MAG: BTAD domain-containing putative transcriptional regulator [Nitrospira sp.]|nr:BTAD domain-containing putative transcriptional regulator [Nitrospira sp.]
MPRQPTTLAKLTRPKLFRVVARDRLFTRLDQERQSHPVVWIAGPPGSGKTALAASYTETRRLPNIWYQVDGGDADPATFFHYLTLAGQTAAGKKRLRLPVLRPEYAPDLPGFTRRYFRELFAGLPTTTTLVLDNYQDVIADSSFHNVIQGAVLELPAGINLLVISRTPPPPQYARILANNLIGQVSWDELRLTLEETTIISRAVKGLSEETLFHSLQNQTNGWVAGLILVLDRFKGTARADHSSRSETMESVFSYFAGLMFDQATVELQEFLMRTAVVPQMTVSMAMEISGNAQASDLLNDLYRRRLFIDRRDGEEIHYQYHDLFRKFLLDRASRYLSVSQLREIRYLGATLAAQDGQIEAAAALLAEAEEWAKLTQLICDHAAALLAQGRHQALQGLIALCPLPIVERMPWLLYWLGLSHTNFNPPAAIADLELAYDEFQIVGDSAGLFLTCGAIMDAYFYAEGEMTPVVAWAERLQQLLTRYKGFPSMQIEAKVLGSLQGLVYAAPHHPLLIALEKRADDFLRSAADPIARIWVACTFLKLIIWRGDFRKARRVLAEINPLLAAGPIPPILLVLWRVTEGNYAWNTASHSLAEEKLREGLHIAQKAGMPLLECMLYGLNVYNALAEGDSRKAEAYLDKAEASNHLQLKHATSQFCFLRAGIALLQNDLANAHDHALKGMEMHEALGRPFTLTANRIGFAQILIESGNGEKARHYLEKAIQYARKMNSSFLEHKSLLVEAYSWIKDGEKQKALTPLREGLRIARENDYLALDLWWRPHVMVRLLSQALQSEIEVVYVKSVIHRRNLTADSPHIENWPWPIRLYTLGRFELMCDDKPLRTPGKSQRKPLELLQCLCAFGGQAVHQDRVTDALWPDAEGDAAAQALRTTLHRLRKLLQHEQAVRLEDRQLFLDPRYIWADCLRFERAVAQADMTDRGALERVMNLYHGHFLQGEPAPWALTYRERLRAHYMSLAERLGISLEEDGNLTGAVDCYLKAFEVEPVAEVFCRRIMIIYGRLGRRTEALAIYQRFGHSIRSRLGINPTQETQALYQALSKE